MQGLAEPRDRNASLNSVAWRGEANEVDGAGIVVQPRQAKTGAREIYNNKNISRCDMCEDRGIRADQNEQVCDTSRT